MDTPNDALDAAMAVAIGRELRVARVRAKNMSQEELAERAGFAQFTVQRWESGKRVPKLTDLRRLCRALGIELHDFVADVMESLEV